LKAIHNSKEDKEKLIYRCINSKYDLSELEKLFREIETKEESPKAEKAENNNAISTGNNSVNQSNIKGDNMQGSEVTKNANPPT
jgi:hypothetical protein